MKRTLAALVAVLGLLAACGDDESTTDDVEASASGSGSASATAEAPDRIVSLTASSTETLFAIGAGDQVVAVDSYSNYPEDAPTTDLSAYEPNVEAISSYEPDLVVVDGTDETLIDGLEALGIEVFEAPAPTDLEGAYDQMVELGEVVGHADEAEELVEEMQAEIEGLVADLPERDEPLTYYHELDSTLFSVTSDTFIGELYSLVGLENIADEADPDGANGGYPQLSTELLVDADPDLVFLADTKCCAQTAETFAARPGFGSLTAVTTGRVVLLDDDIASRWGPRIVDLLAEIAAAVEAVPAA